MTPIRTRWGSRLAALPSLPADRSVAAVLVVSGLAAAGLAVLTDSQAHLVWGWMTAPVFVWAALRSVVAADPAGALRLAALGSTVAPMGVLVLTGVGQPEVGVVQRSAQVLLDTGSPYLAEVHRLADVNPYLPGMSLFGLPAQVFGSTPLADPRPWFLAALVACLWAAARVAGEHWAPQRRSGTVGELLASPVTRVWAVLACPLVALHAAVGGHDLPVVGLAILGLACAGSGRPVATGLALGAAASMHALVGPVLPVAVVLLAVPRGAARALGSAVLAVAVPVALTLPVLLGPAGSSALGQLAGFPLASGELVSPADTPFPGVLLALGGPGARTVGLGLLVAAAVALAVVVLVRRPQSVQAAAGLAALGVTTAVLLLPASRSGYLLLPAALLLWAAGGRDAGSPAEPPPVPCGDVVSRPVAAVPA